MRKKISTILVEHLFRVLVSWSFFVAFFLNCFFLFVMLFRPPCVCCHGGDFLFLFFCLYAVFLLVFIVFCFDYFFLFFSVVLFFAFCNFSFYDKKGIVGIFSLFFWSFFCGSFYGFISDCFFSFFFL